MTTQPNVAEPVKDFYERYPQLASAEVTWVKNLDWRGGTVLDAGCGDGAVLESIERNQPLRRGIGLDTSEDSLRTAARRQAPALHWVKGSIFGIPLHTGAVDDVLSIGVVHYFEDPEPILREYARVTRPGGRVILFVYRPHVVHVVRQWAGRRWKRRFAKRLERVRSEVERNLIMNTVAPPQYWTLSRQRLLELAAASGLRLESILHKPTHVPQLILAGPHGAQPGLLRRALAAVVSALVKIDPLHVWSFGWYVTYRREA